VVSIGVFTGGVGALAYADSVIFKEFQFLKRELINFLELAPNNY
jgi:hypothetical protein